MRDLRIFVRELIKEMGDKTYDQLKTDLSEMAIMEATWQARVLRREISFSYDVLLPAPAFLEAIVVSQPLHGRLLRDWTSEWSSRKQDRVSQQIQLGLAEGAATEVIIKRLSDPKIGALNQSRFGLRALVHTASSDVLTRSRDLLYEQNRDIIDKWLFVATLDSRTTAICRALDGKTFPIGKGPKPPRHIRCRSTTAPVTKSWDELFPSGGIDGRTKVGKKFLEMPEGERPFVRGRMTGTVPASMTYDAWLRTQSANFQDEVLGKAKGKLFRTGKLSLDNFVDMETGREFTLSELKLREPDVWGSVFND
jgi:SPP1 gp7 family putative phage head morphogenesis protein